MPVASDPDKAQQFLIWTSGGADSMLSDRATALPVERTKGGEHGMPEMVGQ